jgi:WD40 repeat protein
MVFTPTVHPLAALATQLAALTGADDVIVAKELVVGSQRAGAVLREALHVRIGGDDSGARVVVVVDQFEELFTLCTDDQQRRTFIDLLSELASPRSDTEDPQPVGVVVVGVRADFYAACVSYPHLRAALQDNPLVVGPMSSTELREAILYPAQDVGLDVEEGLVELLLGDLGDTATTTAESGMPNYEAGRLPLLAHALRATWQQCHGHILTVKGYRTTGGIPRAVATTAEDVFTRLDTNQQRIARRVFLRLTALGEGTEDTRRRVRRDELDADGELPDTAVVVDRLAAARLVILGEDTVEIAHEALIQAWPRLRQWLTDDRAGLRTYRQLTEAAHAWAVLDRDSGALYRGARLTLAREWADRDEHRGDLNRLERAFLDTSVELEERERTGLRRRARHLRVLAVGLAFLLLVVTVVSVVAIHQRQDAVHARQVAVSRQLAAEALAMVDFRPGTAMLLSVEAFRIAPTVEARSALLSMSAHESYRGEFNAHAEAISEVAFSPDGRTLATASRDQTVTLWDMMRRTRLATLTGHTTWLRTVAFSPDGRLLATGGDDQKAVLWDLAGRTQLATLTGHTGRIRHIVFSPDGRTLATASHDQTVMLWDTDRHMRLATLTGHTGSVPNVAFSPDGRILATASADQTIGLWDSGTGMRLATLSGHTKAVSAVAFSPDGRILASAGNDHTVMLWDIERRTQLATLTGHTGPVRAVEFSPDGRILASAGHDRTVMLWDTERRTRLATLTGHTGAIYTLAFNPQDLTLASAGEDGMVVLRNPTLLALSGHTDWVNDVAFSPDGHTLATASTDQNVMLWDTERRTPLATLTGNTGPVNAVAFSPDGRTLATATGAQEPPRILDYTLSVWSPAERASPVKLTGHTDVVTDVAFSSDGRTLATASRDRTVGLWDMASRTRLATLTGHTNRVNAVAFSPDGHTLATASSDRTVALWDVASRTRLAILTGNTEPITAVTFSPDGRALATASRDQALMLWDVASGTRLATLTGHSGVINPMATVAFSPDGRTLASTSVDRTVALWDVASRTRLATLTGHTDQLHAVAFSPDSRTLATASADQTTILWNTDTQQTTTHICNALARNLTPREWTQFLPDMPYHKTCAV